MYIIKRYTNRKLYDTEKNKYINLEEIAILIRQGKEILVIDNASGDDITSVTLTQIILDREKKDGNFLPQSILSALIQARGESISALREKISLHSDFIQNVDEEIHKRLQRLIQRGEIAEDLGKKLYAKLHIKRLRLGDISTITNQDISESLERNDVLCQQEFQQLKSQVDQLLEKVESLRN
jgi:polyhydroxyalkanoate synthesis repressor PhaR